MKMTTPTLRLLAAFLKEVGGEHYGYDLMRQANLDSGTLYPILIRLEQNEWLESHWEDIDESVAGRRRRRFYRLTDKGQQLARSELSALQIPLQTAVSHA
jgi:PadR family transcriptional regulator, regulatory protein PadR